MKTKPNLSFWKMWDLSFGFFGVQIAYSLQTANVSRIFTTIGADPHDLSYFWILPPLMGLIVQPLVGMFSDKTWTRFGRRLPYLMIGATIAVIVMCMLPNAGSFHFSVSNAIIFGIFALMLLDTSINMAMQPFKMLVGDMVNDEQKGKAYSIQSFLCNAGSIIGYALPFCLVWLGMKNSAPQGEVPQTVVWSFYVGAAVLMVCVIYSLIKIREWPPKVYNEYNGVEDKKEKGSSNLFQLLINAPITFWSVGLVQFFCWFAFLLLWTYAAGTVAYKTFDTPTMISINGISDGEKDMKSKYVLANDTLIVSQGSALAQGVSVGKDFYPASQVIINGIDTIVSNHLICKDAKSVQKAEFGRQLSNVSSLKVNGKEVKLDNQPVIIEDYLSRLSGPVDITTAGIYTKEAGGKVVLEDDEHFKVEEAQNCRYLSSTVLNSASEQYNNAGNWLGLLYAVQALGSVLWAIVLPRFKSRKLSYILSLLLGAVGFILLAVVTNQWVEFVAFLLIGCAWSAMLAWPFTILTNSLKSGNIGSYLGLFNCTICIPQIVAAVLGGRILSLMSTPGELAPEYKMMIIAGIVIAIGAICVLFIKEGTGNEAVEETPEISENI